MGMLIGFDMNNEKHRTVSSETRIAEATRTGKLGYFEVAYTRWDGHEKRVCFMSNGWADAKATFEGFGLGTMDTIKEISFDTFTTWYKALIKQVQGTGEV